MEPVSSIPQVFFFSYADAQKNGWAFDIRSLVHLTSQGQALQNPYTVSPYQSLPLPCFESAWSGSDQKNTLFSMSMMKCLLQNRSGISVSLMSL